MTAVKVFFDRSDEAEEFAMLLRRVKEQPTQLHQAFLLSTLDDVVHVEVKEDEPNTGN